MKIQWQLFDSFNPIPMVGYTQAEEGFDKYFNQVRTFREAS